MQILHFGMMMESPFMANAFRMVANVRGRPVLRVGLHYGGEGLRSVKDA